MNTGGVVTFTDAIAIALITSRMVTGGKDPRWYVRHGGILGAILIFGGRYASDYAIQRAAMSIADANGGKLPAGYEMFQPYLPDSYTGVPQPNATPGAPALPRSTSPGVTT